MLLEQVLFCSNDNAEDLFAIIVYQEVRLRGYAYF